MSSNLWENNYRLIPCNNWCTTRLSYLSSPLLVIVDWVGKTAYNDPKGIRWTFTTRLEDLEFADDICTLAHLLQDAQHQADGIEKTAKRTGLYINPEKTKTMKININKQDPININNTFIEDVNFTYLGSIVSTTGGTDEDIIARKKKAQQAFSIFKPVWRSRALKTCTKIRIFNSNVKSVLLYGSET